MHNRKFSGEIVVEEAVVEQHLVFFWTSVSINRNENKKKSKKDREKILGRNQDGEGMLKELLNNNGKLTKTFPLPSTKFYKFLL